MSTHSHYPGEFPPGHNLDNVVNNAISSRARTIAIDMGLTVPRDASDRLTRKRASDLRWAIRDVEKVFSKAQRGVYKETTKASIFSINKGTGRSQKLNVEGKPHRTKARTIKPSKLHARIQKWFEGIGGKSESYRIDSLIKSAAFEIKPVLSAGEFDKAVGKLIRVRFNFGHEMVLVGLTPLGTAEMAQLVSLKISYVCLNWKTKTIDNKNSRMSAKVKKVLRAVRS